MKEKEARELLKELFERHDVLPISVDFHPNVLTTQKETIVTPLGGVLTHIVKIYGLFRVKKVRHGCECWIEFYGLPSATTVRHEFKHYLEFLGVEYIRKKG